MPNEKDPVAEAWKYMKQVQDLKTADAMRRKEINELTGATTDDDDFDDLPMELTEANLASYNTQFDDAIFGVNYNDPDKDIDYLDYL